MPPRVIRLYRFHGPDRVAVVSTEPAFGQQGGFLVRVARGAKTGKLSGGTTYGPFSPDDTPARFDEAVQALVAEGFVETGLSELLSALDHPAPAARARAALLLGRRKSMEAV